MPRQPLSCLGLVPRRATAMDAISKGFAKEWLLTSRGQKKNVKFSMLLSICSKAVMEPILGSPRTIVSRKGASDLWTKMNSLYLHLEYICKVNPGDEGQPPVLNILEAV